MNTPATQNQTTNNSSYARLDLLFSQIPDHVYDWLFSEQAAKNVVALGKKFRLTDSQTIQMSRLTGMAILKDVSFTGMAMELKKTLNIDDQTTRQMTVDIALTQFLPIRDHLQGAEDFIKQLGASLPATLPPLLKTSSPINYQTAPTPTTAPDPTITVIQKTLRQLAQENKDALNQNLTTAPIKIADFDQPVRPTIKNWLVDYVKIKEAGHHESLERSDYLFNSANARVLAEEERALVAEILRAYDDDLPLPVDSQDQTILLEKLNGSTPIAPTPTKPAPPRQPIQPAPNRIASTPTAPRADGNYREPISNEDLSGPLKQTPAKPTPRLS